jgi:DNA-binding NtrC family response regulator
MSSDRNPAVTLLAIDDEPDILELITETLSQQGLQILTASDPDEGLRIFSEKRPRIALVDRVMPKMTGIEVLERMLAMDPGAEVVVMTGHYSTDAAVEAIQKGACNYLDKPLNIPKLQAWVQQLLDQARQRHRASELQQELLETFQFEGIVGGSLAMLDIFTKIRRVAPHFRSMLVTGATGTGKELVARALHRYSPVSSKPFVVCNCSAIAETLFESELFGYVRGAFTGANQDKAGLFESANGGTVFLDEIGELPVAAQAKLLRVLQNQEVQRVGSPNPRKVDVRVIAATNRNLKAMVNESTFRDDLYYRLAMVEIRLPRLVERREDIPLLQRHFLKHFEQLYNKTFRGITRRAQLLISRYHWPGNVRELENAIGSACMLTQGDVIDVQDLPEELRAGSIDDLQDGMETLEAVVRRHVLRILDQVGGNKNRAAEILGISRTTLYNILERIGESQKAAQRNSHK